MKRSETYSFLLKPLQNGSLRKSSNFDNGTPTVLSPESSPIVETLSKTDQEKDILKKMKVNTGKSLDEISQNHRIILFTIKWFGNHTCNELLEKIAEQFEKMLQTNTIPIIAHQQSQKTVNSFFENCKNPMIKKFLYTKVEKQFRSILGLYDSSLKEHLKTLGGNLKLMLQSNKSFQFPSDVISPLTCYGIFMIEDSGIIKRIVWEDFSKMINFHLLLQDLSLSKSLDSEEDFVTKMANLFELDGKTLKRLYKGYKNKLTDIERGVTELKSVLEDDSKRYFLKKFAQNEYSGEPFTFYEEVLAYKLITDVDKKMSTAEKILKNFLEDQGIYQVNTTAKLIHPIKDKILKFAFYQIQDSKEELILQNEIFDDVVDDVILNQISDIFFRFKKSKLYEEMESKCSKDSFLF